MINLMKTNEIRKRNIRRRIVMNRFDWTLDSNSKEFSNKQTMKKVNSTVENNEVNSIRLPNISPADINKDKI